MVTLADVATSHSLGLLVTFLGIGLLVNGLLVYIAVLVIGERRENRVLRERRPGADATRGPGESVEPV
jgi:hypothetical protein